MRSKHVRTSTLVWPNIVRWGFCRSTTYTNCVTTPQWIVDSVTLYIAKVRVSVCCDVISHYTGSFTTSAIHHTVTDTVDKLCDYTTVNCRLCGYVCICMSTCSTHTLYVLYVQCWWKMLEHVKCVQFEGTREYSHRITSISTQYIHRSRCKKAVSRLACTVRAKCDLIAFVLCMWATQAEAISMSPSLCPCMLQGSHVCTLTAVYTCLPAPMLVSALTWASATVRTYCSSPLKWVCARKGLHCVCMYVSLVV